MKLLIVRHAVAMEKDAYRFAAEAAISSGSSEPAILDDDFRPLTLEGSRKMKKVARALASLNEKPSLLISSPLTRALQTAELLQDRWPSLEILVSDDLRPGSKPQALATWINQRIDGEELVVIVGHEPHLSSLVTWLLRGTNGHAVELKKGGACLVNFPAGPVERGAGVLHWLATPSMLRALKL